MQDEGSLDSSSFRAFQNKFNSVVLNRWEISSMQWKIFYNLMHWEIVLSFTPISNEINLII